MTSPRDLPPETWQAAVPFITQVKHGALAIAHSRGLPNVNRPPPNLALLVLGKAMAQMYWPAASTPLPEALAVIVRELERLEARNGQSR